MKLLLLLLFPFSCSATTYYVKPGGGTGAGTSDATAWSAAYFTTRHLTLAANDEVLFARGGTYLTKIQIEQANLKFGAYGTGAQPIITAMTTLTSWTAAGGNIYYASVGASFKLNAVLLDSKMQQIGRYPNTGWLHYTSHSGNTSITGPDITSLPESYTDAQLVMRKNRHVIDRHQTYAQAGSTISYNASGPYGNSNTYSPFDGNGFFLQDSYFALDQLGEWVYLTGPGYLYMYLPGGLGSHVVKAPIYDRNVQLNFWSGARFSNLTFEGGNSFGAWNSGCSDVVYSNCNWINQGGDAIWASTVDGITVDGGSISTALNNGIYFVEGVKHGRINGLNIEDAGTVAGAGLSGDGSQNGILLNGDSITVSNCNINRVGYNGISFYGDSILIKNNIVDSFCLVKDDGGGVYTYNVAGPRKNRYITGNTITHGVGAFAGAEGYYYAAFGEAAGIYLDEGTNHSVTTGNTVTGGSWFGIFLNNSTDSNTISGNTVSGYPDQFHLIVFNDGQVRETRVLSNQFLGSRSVGLHFYNSETPEEVIYFAGNTYTDPKFYVRYEGVSTDSLTLAQWLVIYPNDGSTPFTTIPISATGKVYLNNGKLVVMSKGNNQPPAPVETQEERVLTVNSSLVSGSVTNFPALVSFTANNLRTIANGGLVADPEGDDIRFYAANGTTILNWEIQSYNPITGALKAWVRVPVMTTSTSIVMKYGNTAVTSFQGGAVGSAWAGYRAVWHMEPKLTAVGQTVPDATGNSRPLTAQGTNWYETQTFSGRVGNAMSLNNSSAQYFSFPAQALTMENSSMEGWVLIFDASNNSIWYGGSPQFYNWFDAKLRLYDGVGADKVVQSGTTSTGVWYHWLVVRAGTLLKMYLNGQPGAATFDGSDFTWSMIGKQGTTTTADMYLDESRMGEVFRDDNFAFGNYNTQNSPATFWNLNIAL